jgi:hypothetical protein
MAQGVQDQVARGVPPGRAEVMTAINLTPNSPLLHTELFRVWLPEVEYFLFLSPRY